MRGGGAAEDFSLRLAMTPYCAQHCEDETLTAVTAEMSLSTFYGDSMRATLAVAEIESLV